VAASATLLLAKGGGVFGTNTTSARETQVARASATSGMATFSARLFATETTAILAMVSLPYSEPAPGPCDPNYAVQWAPSSASDYSCASDHVTLTAPQGGAAEINYYLSNHLTLPSKYTVSVRITGMSNGTNAVLQFDDSSGTAYALLINQFSPEVGCFASVHGLTINQDGSQASSNVFAIAVNGAMVSFLLNGFQFASKTETAAPSLIIFRLVVHSGSANFTDFKITAN
jgi:hypothetical protein